MGVYYKVACDEAKENIDPGAIDDLGIKAPAIAALDHPFGAVVIYAMLYFWKHPVRLVNDMLDDPGYFEYSDVTADVLKAYNERYETNMQYTGGFETKS